MTESPAPALTLPEILRNIAAIEAERAKIPLLNLGELEARIQAISPRVVAGIVDKAELEVLLMQKTEAERHWQRHGELNRQLARLKVDLQLAEGEQRQAKAQAASRELEAANSEYYSLAKQLVRTYRRCMNLQARNRGIPGADVKIMPGPHVPINREFGYGNGFTTAQEMGMGLLPFEQSEKEQQNG